MNPITTHPGTAALALLVLLIGAATLRCSGDASQGSGGGSGAAGGSGAEAGHGDATAEAEASATVDSGQAGWLPLEPLGENGEYFPEGPAAPAIDCNPWCKAIIPIPVVHPGYFTFGFDDKHVVDGDLQTLYLVDLATGSARIVARATAEKQGVVQAHVHGRYLSYQRSEYPHGQVEIIDLEQKKKRIIHKYVSEQTRINQTAVNATHAFWTTSSALWAADLGTGEKRMMTPLIVGCDRHCTTDTLFLCSTTSQIASVEPVSGTIEILAPTQALQADGVCSPDKRFFTWVDYRDPPGQDSTYDGTRTGGEVYVYELASKDVKRITSDSPNAPKGKTYPAMEGNTVVWRQPASHLDQNPEWSNSLYNTPISLWRADLSTGKKCFTDMVNVSRPALIGGKLYTLYINNNEDGPWLVEIDLDHPAITWTCPQ